MDVIVEAFGEYTVANIVVTASAIIAIYNLYARFKKNIIDRHDREQRRDEEIQIALDHINECPSWREHNTAILQKLSDSIDLINKRIDENARKLDRLEAERNARELNKLRSSLLRLSSYYTSSNRNPTGAWTETESDVFWKMFKDYESLGGNGDMHTRVEPAMRELKVIPLDEDDQIKQLMLSRK